MMLFTIRHSAILLVVMISVGDIVWLIKSSKMQDCVLITGPSILWKFYIEMNLYLHANELAKRNFLQLLSVGILTCFD